MVMATPLIQAVKNRWPEAEINVLTERRAVDVVKGWNIISHIFLMEEKGWERIFYTEWDKVFVCEPFSPDEIHDPKKLLTKDLRWHGRANLFKKHEVIQNLDLLEKDKPAEVPAQYIQSHCADFKIASDLLAPITNYKNLVGICYGYAGKAHHRKNWGAEKYVELAKKLEADGSGIIIIGGTNEAEEVSKFSEINNKVIAIKQPLAVTAALTSLCDLFICNDCGPMHVAAAMQVPTIAIFGPTYQVKNRPWMDEDLSYIFQSKLSCVPCYFSKNYSTCSDHACMKSISVEQVFNKAQEFLKVK
jgi:ADP-heptose:LPS heptosyltransferase